MEGASHHGLLSTSHPHLKDKLDFKMLAQREALFSRLKMIENNLVIFIQVWLRYIQNIFLSDNDELLG